MSCVCPPCDIVLYWSTRVSYYCTLVSYQVCTYDPPYAVAYSDTYTYSTWVLGTPYLVQVPIENHGDAAIGTRQYRGVLRESHTLQYCTNYWQQASYSIVLQVQGTEKNLVKQIPCGDSLVRLSASSGFRSDVSKLARYRNFFLSHVST